MVFPSWPGGGASVGTDRSAGNPPSIGWSSGGLRAEFFLFIEGGGFVFEGDAEGLGDLGESFMAGGGVAAGEFGGLRHFGPEHPNVARCRSSLGSILHELGEHQGAREQMELALASDLRHFGPEHPTVAVRRSNLATILRELGEHQAAREQIELALASDLRQLGPDHPRVAGSRLVLAQVLYELQEYPAALREMEQALAIFRAKLPAGHPHIGVADGDLSLIRAAMGS